MTRRDYCLQQADQEIRRLIREGFGLFRIAELYDVPVIRYCNDARALSSTPTGSICLITSRHRVMGS